MADFKESIEKIKAQLEPFLASASEAWSDNVLPSLLSLKQQLIERWRETPGNLKIKAAGVVLGSVSLMAGCVYLYRLSSIYARRQLVDLHYEMAVSGFTNACRKGDVVALNFFVQAKWPIDSRDDDGLTTLMSAAEKGDSNCVRELVGRGADPNLKNDRGESAIFLAIRSHSLETVNAVLKSKPELNFFNNDKSSTPLMAAMTKPEKGVIQALLDAGADPNQQDAKRHTALFLAAAQEDALPVTTLLTKKADPNIVDSEGMTPLAIAILNHRRDNVIALLKAGAKPNLPGNGVVSALHLAIDENQLEIAQDLLAAGADPNQLSRAGLTPLVRSVATADEKLVTALLAKGANANARIRLPKSEGMGQAADLEEITALDMAYFMHTSPADGITKIESLLKESGARAVISRTVRGATKDWDSLRLIEKIHSPSAQFVRGRVIEAAKAADFPAVLDLVHKFGLPYYQFLVVNVGGSALLVTTDTNMQANSMFTLNALKWGSAQTSLGMIPVYIESNRTGNLQRRRAELLKNSYLHFLGEWADRMPTAYGQALKIKSGSGSGLTLDDLTLLSALLFGDNNFGHAVQVYQAARSASLCAIQARAHLSPGQWASELSKVLDYAASSEPSLVDIAKRKVTLQNELCGTKTDFKGDAGEIITFSQCMCGSYSSAPVPAPGPEHLVQLNQIVADYRNKLQSQAQMTRTPASK